MPTIAMFYGCNLLRIVDGALPRRAAVLVLEWLALRRLELIDAWNAAQQGLNPGKIAPLE